MSKSEFLKELGLASPEDKVTEIVVPEDKVKKADTGCRVVNCLSQF